MMLVRVRGVTYPSVRQAAQSLNVTENAVYSALFRGRIEVLGLANTQKKPVAVEGLFFPSIACAARKLGLSEKYLCRVIATDSVTGMKRFRAAAAAYKQSIENTINALEAKP